MANQLATWSPLERGHKKRELIHAVANGTHTQAELAEKFGVTQSAINQFIKRNAHAIARVKTVLDQQFHEQWIAVKENRIQEYQQDVEDINDDLPDVDAIQDKAALMRVKHTALRSVAEEVGELPAKTAIQVNQTHITYSIDGVDMDALR